MVTVILMDEWKKDCEEALRAALLVGIDAPDLVEALKKDDTDEAMMGLSPLMLMLDGAKRVLGSSSPVLCGRLFRQVENAYAATMQAFKTTAAAGGFQPMDEGTVCSVDT